jgi:hypothetical protein
MGHNGCLQELYVKLPLCLKISEIRVPKECLHHVTGTFGAKNGRNKEIENTATRGTTDLLSSPDNFKMTKY